MEKYIDSNMVQIGEFLSNVNSLKVPPNQRDFAWTDDEIQQFWTDITEALDMNQPEYFLGPMVLKKDGDILEIIDGQQRIATVYIILSVIRRILRENGDDQRADWFKNEYFGKQNVETLKLSPKFHMNDLNDPVFQKYIIADSSATKIENKMKGLLKKNPNYLLLQAILMIWEFLLKRQKIISGHEFDLDTLLNLERYLKKNISVLILTVTDAADAYVIFETLNDRGIGLNTMDLLKNHVFGKSGDYFEQTKSLWVNIKDNLSDIDPRERFLFHYWSSIHGRAPKTQLFRLIRNHIQNPESALAFAKDLSETSRLYSALCITGHPFWNNYDQRTRENLETLNLLDAQQALPILLAAIKKFANNEFRKLTEILVVMAIRYNLIGELRTGVLSNYYVEIPKKIQNNEIKKSGKVFMHFKPIYPSDNDFEEAFSKKVLKDSKKARYLLSEIEKFEYGGTHKIVGDPNQVNLEHIFPKNPSQEWNDTIDSVGDDLDEYIHRIGNLALVSATVHKGIGTKGFDKKKEKLFSKEKNIKYTKIINEYSTWLRADIEDRQSKLAKQAPKIWCIVA